MSTEAMGTQAEGRRVFPEGERKEMLSSPNQQMLPTIELSDGDRAKATTEGLQLPSPNASCNSAS